MDRRARAPPLLLLLLWPPLLAVAGPACKMNAFEPAPDGARLVGERLRLAGRPGSSYPPTAYRRIPGGGFVLCTCEIKTCVHKCCRPGKAFNGTRCTEVDDSPRPARAFEVPKFVNESGMAETYEPNQIHIIYNGGPQCIKDYFELDPINEPDHNFGVSATGDLQNVSGSFIASPEEFCLDQLINEKDFPIRAIVCARYDITYTPDTGFHFHIPRNTRVMMISLPFLILTFLVYAVITELHNLHGKSVMCFAISLFIAYTTSIINQIVIIAKPDAFDFCTHLTYSQQFFSLATFFWLNVMCYDLWTNIRAFNQNSTECKPHKFINYSKYAWGCPVLISTFTIFMDKYFSIQYGTQIILPEFEYYNTCWFHSKIDKLLYFHGPIGITLFSNLLMFVHNIIMMIVKHLKYAKLPVELGNRLSYNVQKQRFMMCLKLFIIMGAYWSTEIISWTINGPTVIWTTIHSFNALQGMWIFLICVYNSQVLVLLNKKLCPCFHPYNRSSPILETSM